MNIGQPFQIRFLQPDFYSSRHNSDGSGYRSSRPDNTLEIFCYFEINGRRETMGGEGSL
jgi:hypothetical protein